MLVAVPPPVAPMDRVVPSSGDVRALVIEVPRPRAPRAALFELVMLRSLDVPVWIEAMPLATVEPVPPVRASIFPGKPATSAVTSISLLPVAPEALNVRVLPLTVRVSPAANDVDR